MLAAVEFARRGDTVFATMRNLEKSGPLQAAAEKPGGTIDALFGPLPAVESVGRVWMQVDGQLVPVRVRLGITDGQMTELIDGDLEEGAVLVSAVNIGAATTRTTTPPGAGGFLFAQPMGRGGAPSGGARR